MYRRNPMFNVTSITASNKAVAINSLKKEKLSVSVIADLNAQLDILLDETSTEEQKKEAINLLTDDKTVFFAQISKENCKSLCAKFNSLNFIDFLQPPFFKKGLNGEPIYCFLNNKKVVGKEVLFRIAIPKTSYLIKNGTKVEFHIEWTYVIPPKYEETSSEEPTPTPTPTEKFNVTLVNNATSVVTSIEPSSGEVDDGEDFTATLTFADGKSASDIEVTGGTVEGNILTVSDVTDDVTVTISEKIPVVTHTVTITNNATDRVTVEPISGEVADGEDFTAALTFGDWYDVESVTVTGATFDINTLTVSNVTNDVTVTIEPKD